MAVWAYACRPCRGKTPDDVWFVAATDCEKLAPDTKIVRVKVKDRWRCARLDRSRRIEVEGLVVRQVVGTQADNCGECEDGHEDPGP